MRYDSTTRRCPKTSCGDYAKRLVEDVGLDETGRDGLTVRWSCPGCGYAEYGPANPTAARRAPTVSRVMTPLRELLQRQRLEGVEIPLRYDTSDFPKGDFDD